jgi:hypothetical protein
MAFKEGYLFKEGGIRHNIKKRWTVVDASGAKKLFPVLGC